MQTEKRIFLIAQPSNFNVMLREQFSGSKEYRLIEAQPAEALTTVHLDINPDIVIFKIFEPLDAVKNLLSALRTQNSGRPIIAIADSQNESLLEWGLEGLVSDFILCPFRFSRLLGRLRFIIQQQTWLDSSELKIGPYLFHPALKRLIDERGEEIRLTEKESAILHYLFQADQQVIGREQLLKEVWGYNAFVTTHTLETHIYRLRQKIEMDPSDSAILVTESGGYKLVI